MKYKKEYKRVVNRFAITPISIYGERRWLEWCYIEQARDSAGVWYDREFTTAPFFNMYRESSESFGNVLRKKLFALRDNYTMGRKGNN